MGKLIEECCGYFGVVEYGGLFVEVQVCGDDDVGVFVEFVQQMEEQCVI